MQCFDCQRWWWTHAILHWLVMGYSLSYLFLSLTTNISIYQTLFKRWVFVWPYASPTWTAYEWFSIALQYIFSTASRSSKCLQVMHYHLEFIIKLPSREVIRNNMPPAIKQIYLDCICIIDCSEIFIDTVQTSKAWSGTYTNYKKM